VHRTRLFSKALSCLLVQLIYHLYGDNKYHNKKNAAVGRNFTSLLRERLKRRQRKLLYVHSRVDTDTERYTLNL